MSDNAKDTEDFENDGNSDVPADETGVHMTLMQHLEELRERLFRVVLFLFVGVAIGFFFAKPVVSFLVRPLHNVEIKGEDKVLKVRVNPASGEMRLLETTPTSQTALSSRTIPAAPPQPFWLGPLNGIAFYLPGTAPEAAPDFTVGRQVRKPIFLGPLDPVFLWIKASAIVGIILALPFILWQIWLFVTPGLTRVERKTVLGLLSLAGVLFPLGVTFAYFLFSLVLNFLLNFQVLDMEPQLEITRFIDLEMKMMLGFGMVFEFPVAIVMLTMMGLVTPEQLRKHRKIAILTITVTAMLITPPDPFSMLLVMLPLFILYEISIWASVPLAKKKADTP